ncbi:AAA family ATPase [Cellulosispirillum alkaliphilum]|uniref:AAA family ATPase n=1 Tax=Cellulosispirillum alkaliphilum TaxID=3039283 RepID=UPI003D6E075A
MKEITDEQKVTQHSVRVIEEVQRAIVGKSEVLKQIMATFLAGGHVLLEDYPGTAKTLIANSFAQALGMSFRRIQFTPDLLPGDITGGYIYDRSQNSFILREGPVFANLILADEINRASPRTQSALLEAMQEQQVTLEGETRKLPEPFIVIATQNPIEYEGTFPLPEAQLDRFLVKLSVGYPTVEQEQQMLRRRRERKQDDFNLSSITNVEEFQTMRRHIEEIHVEPDIERYIIDLTHASRKHPQVTVGAGPRATLALLKLSRAWAAMHERNYVLPDDVKAFVKPVLTHRIIPEPDLWTMPDANDRILNEILKTAKVPVI